MSEEFTLEVKSEKEIGSGYFDAEINLSAYAFEINSISAKIRTDRKVFEEYLLCFRKQNNVENYLKYLARRDATIELRLYLSEIFHYKNPVGEYLDKQQVFEKLQKYVVLRIDELQKLVKQTDRKKYFVSMLDYYQAILAQIEISHTIISLINYRSEYEEE